MATHPLRLLVMLALAMLCAGCGTTRFMAIASTPALSAAPAGQVLINIIRPSSAGRDPFRGVQDIPIFDGTAGTLIGNLGVKERVQYVCPPGERMFIGWGEHKSGVAASLVADHVYDLICDVGWGIWRPSVSLRPIPKDDERRTRLQEWENSTTLLQLADYKDASEWTTHKQAAVRQVTEEFRTAPTERVMVLKADDHR